MAEGFKCDSCKTLFAGKPAMRLDADFITDEFQHKMKSDCESGEYCTKCAMQVISAIGKRWCPN